MPRSRSLSSSRSSDSSRSSYKSRGSWGSSTATSVDSVASRASTDKTSSTTRSKERRVPRNIPGWLKYAAGGNPFSQNTIRADETVSRKEHKVRSSKNGYSHGEKYVQREQVTKYAWVAPKVRDDLEYESERDKKRGRRRRRRSSETRRHDRSSSSRSSSCESDRLRDAGWRRRGGVDDRERPNQRRGPGGQFGGYGPGQRGPMNPNPQFVNPNPQFVNPNPQFMNPNQQFVNPNQQFVNPNQQFTNPGMGPQRFPAQNNYGPQYQG